jgi:chaperone modulatory protein CbpM
MKMASTHTLVTTSVVVEEEINFNLDELSRVCGVRSTELILLIDEGILEPAGSSPETWLFTGASLRRARQALRLTRELQVGLEGTAIVLELMDQIEQLRSQLRQVGRQ